jgi:hypothetical protein
MPRRELNILALLVACFLVGFAGFLLFRGRSAKEITPEEGVSHTHDEADQSDRLHDHSHDLSDDHGDLIDVSDMTELMDMTPAEMLALKWNGFEVTCDFSDYQTVAKAVDAIQVSGEPNLSEDQEQNLKKICSQVLFHNGRNEVGDFFSFLEESGEVVDEYLLQVVREWLVEAMHMTDEELPTDPWKLVELYWKHNSLKRTAWSGFARDNSEIRIRIMKDKASADRMPGQQFWAIGGRSQSVWAHFGVPPVSIEEIIAQKGEVVVVDVILFIAHDESLSEEIFPYFIRYWFDPVNDMWRPHRAKCFPRSGSGYHHDMAY